MYGLGFRVLDSWFVVYGSWLRVSSFRFQGSGLMVLSFLSSVYKLGLGVQGLGCRVLVVADLNSGLRLRRSW